MIAATCEAESVNTCVAHDVLFVRFHVAMSVLPVFSVTAMAVTASVSTLFLTLRVCVPWLCGSVTSGKPT